MYVKEEKFTSEQILPILDISTSIFDYFPISIYELLSTLKISANDENVLMFSLNGSPHSKLLAFSKYRPISISNKTRPKMHNF